MVDADVDDEVGVAFKWLRSSNVSGFKLSEKNKWTPKLSMLKRVAISVPNLLKVQFSIFPDTPLSFVSILPRSAHLTW